MAEVTQRREREQSSGAQLAKKFLLVHVVLEGFAAIDENYRDFIGIDTPDFGVRIYVNFTPGKATTPLELDEALLDDFAEMTSLAGVNDNFPRLRHSESVAVSVQGFQGTEGRRIFS